MNLKLNITKKQFEKLFKIFSLILLLDYPILPLLETVINDKQVCNYNAISYTMVFLAFILIIWCFWSISWLINYVVFFVYDISEIESKKLRIFSFYFKYIWKIGQNKKVRSSFLEVLVIECFGVLFMLLFQINALIF